MATAFDQQLFVNLTLTRRYARALIGDTELANEAVMHAITGVTRFTLPWIPGKLVRLWLVHLVHEYVDQRLEPTSSTIAEDDHDKVEIPPFNLPTNDDVGSGGLLIHRVDTMLQELTEQQRRIYLLLAVESFALENVALLLRLPAETVRSEFESIKTQLAPSPKSPTIPIPKAA